MMALQSFYKSMGIDCSFKHVFNCDIKKSVQDWVEGMLRELRIPSSCLFHDAEELVNGEGICVRHNQFCNVMPANLGIAGTSCKDFSKANTHRTMNSCQMNSSPGASAHTLNAFLHYLMQHIISLMVLENSDTLDEPMDDESATAALKVISPRLREACFSCQSSLTDAALFGCPQ